MEASWKGHLDVVNVLIELEVDLDAQETTVSATVVLVLSILHLIVVVISCINSLFYSSTHQWGCTALHRASSWSQSSIVKALLKAGADTTLKNKVKFAFNIFIIDGVFCFILLYIVGLISYI